MKKQILVVLALTGMLGFLAAPSLDAEAAWKSNANGRWYTTNNAKGYYIGWKKIGNSTYYFNQDGYAVTGWRYLNRNKKSWFFFDFKGRMLKNCWVDGFYLNNDGTLATNTTVQGIPLDAKGNPQKDTGGTGPSQDLISEAAMKSRWAESEGKWYYYDYRGKLSKGWLTIKDKTYYLNPETGARMSGVVKVDKKYYYFDSETGVQKKGWIKHKNKTYYFHKSEGYALTKWQKIKNQFYYFNNKGVMAVNKWISKYYVGADGAMVKGWLTLGADKYYMDPGTGIRTTNIWLRIKKKWYYFNRDGVMARNQWVGKYYLQSNGVMATKKWVGKHYVNARGYKTGKTRKTGFFTQKGKTYYLNKNYKKMTGWVEVDKKFYHFNSKGVMLKNTWINDSYVGNDGTRIENKLMKINNVTYLFLENGVKATGLIGFNSNTYYFDNAGAMQTGWQTILNNKHYFLPSNGTMAVNTVLEISGVYYSFDTAGYGKVLESENADISLGKAIADYACKFIGNPYVYGGTSLTKGADCSGFTMSVMKHFGINIPRVAADQATGTSAWATEPYAKAKPVAVKDLRPGDLIFYYSPISHVGIYIGDGLIVHASNSQPYPVGGIKTSVYDYAKIVKCVRYW